MTNISEPKTIYLKDYRVPDYLVESVSLDVDIQPGVTHVKAALVFRRNDATDTSDAALVLNGSGLNTITVSIDGQPLTGDQYQLEEELLTIPDVPHRFTLETLVAIDPENNTSLEGLYKSGTMFCTQCEAEGFRKITWYPDRPDVMSVFTTRIEADKEQFPVLLANGNPVDSGDSGNGRHYAVWHDPFPKPSYLFAMVAGRLVRSDSCFTTCSGRNVDIHVYVESHNAHKTDFAHEALHRAMKWDEQRFGREYDLDLFMIVASDFFNMGAMENKGLNIFNSTAVLADPHTTTDAQFERIESIIGHEYFHNWSGNRVTCRDWFQLSLKEGFTVFRDSEFTADLHSRAVKRMDDVSVLRTHQFAQDAGAMAHPVRPSNYIEINNFYTLTVYEKGCEVVRMVHTLLGEEKFREGCDYYFSHFDGQAATIEDFIGSMHAVSGFDFSGFMLWYEQAGTPRVRAEGRYDAGRQEYVMQFSQQIPDTHGQVNKKPMLIPVRIGLLDREGRDMTLSSVSGAEFNPETSVLSLTESAHTVVFHNISSEPLPSLLRDFSAPVYLDFSYTSEQLAFLMAHDQNAFNQWDAAQRLMVREMLELIRSGVAAEDASLSPVLINALATVITDPGLDNAVKDRMLTLPSASYLFDQLENSDILRVWKIRRQCAVQLGIHFAADFAELYQSLASDEPYSFNAAAYARRALRNQALAYWVLSGEQAAESACLLQAREASNFTDISAALTVAVNHLDNGLSGPLLEEFIDQWKDDPIMVQFWLGVQSASANCPLEKIKELEASSWFDIRNPNQVRRLIGTFAAANISGFNREDGSGYRYLADKIIELNSLNPMIASRLCTQFQNLPRHTAPRQSQMRSELERIVAMPGISKDVYEIASRILKG